MKDQVEEIKSKIDIVEIIGERVALKKAGRHFKGLCPFHSEKSPSFIVSLERQSFKCFGCQEGGDVLTFLQKYDGMSFLESLETLAKRVGITLESYRPTSQDAYKKKLLEIMSLASEYYHFLLTKHQSGEEARQYLKARGIGSEAITQFNLGYAPKSWQSVSDFLVSKKKYAPEDLEAVGLVIRKDNANYYDRFRGRVMFPLKDHRGVVVGFSGRTLSSEPTEAKYINSPETMLYSKSRMLYGLWENREYVRKADSIVLVEGELDLIPSWQGGVKNSGAIKGSAFTYEQAKLITRFTKNILMSLDADRAGEEAIKRAVIVAEQLDLSIRVVQIRNGKDPGEVATKDPGAWRKMVSSAVLYWDFLIESSIERNDPKSGEGAQAISREVVPSIAEITNAVVRAHYAQLLAKRLGVPEESIYSEIERSKKKKDLNMLKETIKEIETSQVGRRGELEYYALALALQFFAEIRVELMKLESAWLSIPAVAKIWDKLLDLEQIKEFNIQTFSQGLPEELQPLLDETYLMDLSGIKEASREWEKTIEEIKEQYVRSELKILARQIKQAEEEGQSTNLLQEKFRALSGILRIS